MEKKLQLFCIPFAGGSSVSFHELSGYIDPFVEVIPVAYPGRVKRAHEPFFENIMDLINDVRNQIVENRDSSLPYAILGYSLGTAIAYDLIQYGLEEKPAYAFLCARASLDLYAETKSFALLGEDAFVHEIQKMGGVDEKILNNRRFLEIYMRPVYADYKLWRQYEYKPEMGKPDTDFTVFYSEEDSPYETVAGWKGLTTGTVDFYEFGHNHFFLFDHAGDMAAVINGKLGRLVR